MKEDNKEEKTKKEEGGGGGGSKEKENNRKGDNYVFMLGDKSNKQLNDDDDDANLPNVFKQLVDDAKTLTQKLKHNQNKSNDKAGKEKEIESFSSGSGEVLHNNKPLSQVTLLKNQGDSKNIDLKTAYHSQHDDEAGGESDSQKGEKAKSTKNKNKSKTALDQPKLISMLKKYIQKSKFKKLYPNNDKNQTSDYTTHRQHSKPKVSTTNDNLGDLGDTKSDNEPHVVQHTKKNNDQDVERVAQNILDKFTTKSGDLDLPNDVVMETDSKINILKSNHPTEKAQKKQNGCCMVPIASPIQPQSPSPPSSAPPPLSKESSQEILIQLPQSTQPQSVPTASSSTTQTNENPPPGPSNEQEKLRNLLEQKEQLDQLQTEYEHELAKFKSELQENAGSTTVAKEKDKKKVKDKNDEDKKDGDRPSDLILPKEMNGCIEGGSFEKMQECLLRQGGKEDKTPPSVPAATKPNPPTGKVLKPVEFDEAKQEKDTKKEYEIYKEKVKEASSKENQIKQDLREDDGDADKQKIEQDAESQTIDILGKDKQRNDERKANEKNKEDRVFEEKNSEGQS